MEAMQWSDFWIVFITCTITMLICRVAPLFLLKGRQLPEKVERALNFIPPAAFAALVANDLFSPTMFDGGIWPGVVPLIAAAVVILVARKTGSLIWCAIVGVAAYALLTYAPLLMS